MRYVLVETVSFVDSIGVSRPVKEMREIPIYETARTLGRTAQEGPDATSVKDEVLGAGSEGSAYRLWEANLVELADAGFDWSKIQKVRIPK